VFSDFFPKFELEKIRKMRTEVFIQGQKRKNGVKMKYRGWEEKNSWYVMWFNVSLRIIPRAH
jgi:hypothetical protein